MSTETKEPRYWVGRVPYIDVFGLPIKDVFVDGRTDYGAWGLMSLDSYLLHGRGLGPGLGQKYVKQPDGRWVKAEG